MHEQLLAAVAARVARIEAEGDPTLALEPGALNDAERLADLCIMVTTMLDLYSVGFIGTGI